MVQPAALRPATVDDAPTVAALSIQVFLDTYAATGISRDIAREALLAYSAEAFTARLLEPARHFLLAHRGEAVLGYAEVLLQALPAPAGGAAGAELVRLYVQPGCQATGLGRTLIRAAEQLAAGAALPALWLTAWEGNTRALGFYAAMGYTDIGETVHRFEDQLFPNRVLLSPPLTVNPP